MSRNASVLLACTVLGIGGALASGCNSLGEAVTQAVVVEYEQSMNFVTYGLEASPPTSLGDPPTPGAVGFTTIRLADHTASSPKRRGVWILYQVCSIKNDAPKAKDFAYDVTKFYVEYNGQKHYYQPLAAYTYERASDGLPANPTVNESIAHWFRLETQRGPDQETIAAGSTATLSIAWCFPIFVATDEPGVLVNDLLELELNLRYDGPNMLMENANHPPESVGPREAVKKADLPVACRPPKAE